MKRQFDPDLPPEHFVNREAAEDSNVTYNEHTRQYEDEDGCPTRDEYGQPLG
jgi:hypothetical protein